MAYLKDLQDSALAALLKEGDHAAYTELYERYSQILFVHVYKRLRDEEQAKDIVQDFFTVLWVKRTSLLLSSSLKGYFFTSVNNRIIDHFLRKNVQDRYVTSFAGFLDRETVKADHLVRERQLAHFINIEIQRLPKKMLQIFELSRKEHLSHKEIAEKLLISEKTVDRQISNALFRLKSTLEFYILIILLMVLKLY